MKYRPLGGTGLTVSEIGFGTWGLGGDAYGAVDDAASRDALAMALDLGVTFYDTSDLYGRGHSEEILGGAFQNHRDRVVIATKVGALSASGFDMPQDFSSASIRRGIEASLRRLRTDYVDLYQLHSPPMDLANWDGVVATLEDLKDAGKIRAFGVSARSPADAKVAVERRGFPVVQVNFNMIDHRAVETGLLELCEARKVGVIARTPLCFGYLSGTLTGDEELQEHDHRAHWPREQLRRWAGAPERFASLNEGTNRSLVQLALQFCLSEDAVSTVIPGMLTSGQVRENTAVASLMPLTQDEIDSIRSIYTTQIVYDPAARVDSNRLMQDDGDDDLQTDRRG